MDIKFVVITAMNKDELTFMKEYVITLESENDSKNRERAMLQRQLDSLLNENNQLRLLRPSNDSQIIVEKNAEISTLIKQIQDQNREI
jgi:type IV secretory pathway component VirB8